MLIYFMKGSLPWKNSLANDPKSKKREIKKVMEKTTLTDLCEGLPK
jgi:hypothetical protein